LRSPKEGPATVITNTVSTSGGGLPSGLTMVRIIVIILLSLPSFLLAQESEPKKEPTLAELAQEQREKTQATTQPVRLITNEDLGGMRGARVVTADSSRSSRSRRQAVKESLDGSEGEATAAAEADPSTMEYWEPAFKEAVDNLKYAANASLVLELRINNFRNGYFREEDGVRRQVLYAEIANSVEQLIESRKEEREAREAVAQLQRDAEKAGLVRGEVRELTGKLPEQRSIIELPDLVDPDLEG